MPFVRVLVAVLVAVSFAAGPASAAKRAKPQSRVIIIDRSWYGPRPPPHERNYVGPAPAVGAPMQPVPRVAPLAQPPLR